MSVDVSNMDFAMFVTKEDGHYLVRASNTDESLPIAALRFAEAGQTEAARIWLNWAREAVPSLVADDPLAGSAFARIWSKSKQTATADEVRLAANVLVAEHNGDTCATLETLREKAQDENVRTLIDRALLRGYAAAENWAKAVAPARRLVEKEPDSGMAFTTLTMALSYTGANAEAESLAKARLERLPDDRDALRALSQNAAARFDFAAAERYAQRVVDLTPERGDYNNAAWYGLLAGNLEHAMENAHKATAGDRAASASLHTLAAVYAETGKTLEAREALLSSMDQRQHDQPQDEDWYVLGRIAESYGVRDAALAAYKHVAKNETPQGDIWRLTSRRLGQIK
jgi:tetratricopeptide (TPR) repeat protein